ncbi:hypothetical protein Syun_009406 [Stephania yunnanensis]|uniref:Uncharacterized protein n=1 Tax=Stephania yunnanensis TaxID=152371 RepID=A0AAP0KGX5_9MAGN
MSFIVMSLLSFHEEKNVASSIVLSHLPLRETTSSSGVICSSIPTYYCEETINGVVDCSATTQSLKETNSDIV